MANGKITLGKQSGGTLGLVFPDGVSNTEVVLPESGNIASVATAVTDNAIARYDGTTGKLQNSGVIIDDSDQIRVKNNIIKPWFTGHKVLTTGNFSSFYERSGGEQHITNNSYGYGSYAYKYITSGLGASKYVNNFGTSTWYNAPAGTEDSVITWIKLLELEASGNLLLTSGTGALGYGAGAGGVVTQLTSKSTSVTLNTPSGQITMHNSTMLPGETVSFYLNNSLLSITDQLFVTLGAGAYSASVYNVWVYTVNGLGHIFVKNTSGASFSESVDIRFSIVKGANA